MLSSPATPRALGEARGPARRGFGSCPDRRASRCRVFGARTPSSTLRHVPGRPGSSGNSTPATTRRLGRLIEELPAVLGDEPPVFAHGDLVPVNLIVRSGVHCGAARSRARSTRRPPCSISHGSAGRCAGITRTRSRRHRGRALLASGLADDAMTHRRLDLLAALRCLELLADMPSSAGARDQLVAAVDAAFAGHGGALTMRSGALRPAAAARATLAPLKHRCGSLRETHEPPNPGLGWPLD